MSGRWLGRCPGCGAFGTMVEEAPPRARAPAAACAHAAAPRRRRGRGGRPDPDRRRRARPRARRRPRPRLARARRRRAGRRQVDAAPVGARRPMSQRRAGRCSSRARSRSRRSSCGPTRLGGAARVEILAETELDAVCATLERERPAVCVIDSVQTLYSAEIGSAPGSVAQVREAAARIAAGREGGRRRDVPRRPRDEGRLGRRPARARAPRRLRAPVRGRPLPRPPRPAGDEEPLRLDERARRLRDDGHRPRRRPRPVGALRPQRAGRGRRRGHLRARGDAAAAARDPVARRADRPRDAAPGRRPASTRSASR